MFARKLGFAGQSFAWLELAALDRVPENLAYARNEILGGTRGFGIGMRGQGDLSIIE
jgi:hypothetical protein